MSLLRSFFIASLFLIAFRGLAQSPNIEWHKAFGSDYGEFADQVLATSDGGFIVTGYSVGGDFGDVWGHHGNPTSGDLWIVKLDRSGNIEWQKSLGDTDTEQKAYIIQTPDGGYMLAGSAAESRCNPNGHHGESDYWVLKLNNQGDILWQKLYGGAKTEIVKSFAPSNDGGYFVAGYSNSRNGDVTLNHGELDYWIIKIDATGKLIWQKSLGGSENDYPGGVEGTADGGCIVAGTSGSHNNGDVTGHHGTGGDFWVVKLDNLGKLQWQKALGGTMLEMATSVKVTSDGGYIVTGLAFSVDGDVIKDQTSADVWVVKLNANGSIAWQKTYGGNSNDAANDIQLTPDGGYIIAGMAFSNDGDVTCNAGAQDALVMKIDKNGILQWQKTLGGTGNDEAVSVKPLKDGSFIIAGNTDSHEIPGFHPRSVNNQADETDYWVIKLSAPVATVPTPVVKLDPASALICKGGTGTITAKVLYGGIDPVYQWKKNGNVVGSNSPYYSDANFKDNDQVSCTVTNNDLCNNIQLRGSDLITIKVAQNPQLPSIVISAENTAPCNCSAITLKATVINGGGSPKYQWRINGIDVNNNTALLISNSFKDGDQVTCMYSDNMSCTLPGSLSNTIKIGGSTKPSVSIIASADTICKGSAVTFTAWSLNVGKNPVYQWKVNGQNAGTNNSIFTSSSLPEGAAISCSIKTDPLFKCVNSTNVSSNNIEIHVRESINPSVILVASSETICKGSTATFTVTAIDAGANPMYQWKINGVNTGENRNVYSTSSLADGDVVNCTIGIQPAYSCALKNEVVTKSITMSVTSVVMPSVIIKADRNNVCAGDKIVFTTEVKNAGQNPSFEWMLNGAVLNHKSSEYSTSILADGDEILCRVIPGTGACSSSPESSNVILAVIKEAPLVHVSPLDTTIASGAKIQLKADVKGSATDFLWTPGNLLTDPLSLFPMTSELTDNTDYTVIVTGDNGCKATAKSTIRIFSALVMPNAFTPNGDGINDLFKIPSNATLDLKEFSIYNRWGSRIFTTTNRYTGWNGMSQGVQQASSAYVYVIRCKVKDKDMMLKGSFILVR